jgi:hypothetical protein
MYRTRAAAGVQNQSGSWRTSRLRPGRKLGPGPPGVGSRCKPTSHTQIPPGCTPRLQWGSLEETQRRCQPTHERANTRPPPPPPTPSARTRRKQGIPQEAHKRKPLFVRRTRFLPGSKRGATEAARSSLTPGRCLEKTAAPTAICQPPASRHPCYRSTRAHGLSAYAKRRLPLHLAANSKGPRRSTPEPLFLPSFLPSFLLCPPSRSHLLVYSLARPPSLPSSAPTRYALKPSRSIQSNATNMSSPLLSLGSVHTLVCPSSVT